MMHRILLACAALLCISAIVSADVDVWPSSSGSSSLTIDWGDSFTLDCLLTSDAGDVHTSAIFRLAFTEPALVYTSYDWADPYTDGSIYDDSKPDMTGLPVVLSEDTLTGPGYSSGVVDLEMSNVLIGETFGEGTLVSLELTVPQDYGFLGSLYIALLPDTFSHGFDEIPASGGQVFELNIIPEPSVGAYMLFTMFAAFHRRRRRQGNSE